MLRCCVLTIACAAVGRLRVGAIEFEEFEKLFNFLRRDGVLGESRLFLHPLFPLPLSTLSSAFHCASVASWAFSLPFIASLLCSCIPFAQPRRPHPLQPRCRSRGSWGGRWSGWRAASNTPPPSPRTAGCGPSAGAAAGPASHQRLALPRSRNSAAHHCCWKALCVGVLGGSENDRWSRPGSATRTRRTSTSQPRCSCRVRCNSTSNVQSTRHWSARNGEASQLCFVFAAAVAGPVRVLSVACGEHHTAAVTDGALLCTFGRGSEGQLGHGDGITKVRGVISENIE